MKLIINIDDKVYNNLKNRGLTGMLTAKECECMNEAIYNGTSLVEELEKIKTEFEEDKYILLNQITAIKVIDRRIAELKGEQK